VELGERTSSLRATITSSPAVGVVDVASHNSVDRTVEKLETLLRIKGVRLFMVVDQSGEAAKVGLEMRPTKFVIFGSPKAGLAHGGPRKNLFGSRAQEISDGGEVPVRRRSRAKGNKDDLVPDHPI
jgi:hypothetical protein